jgi:hypothetical protein
MAERCQGASRLRRRVLRLDRSGGRPLIVVLCLAKGRPRGGVGHQGCEENDRRFPDVGLRPQSGVVHQTEANKRERDRGAAKKDGAQQGAARLGRMDTNSGCSPRAAETELPALTTSLNLIELNEHRLCPVHPISQQPAHSEHEQCASPIAASRATDPRNTHDCRKRERHREDKQRQDEQRGYDTPRSSGRRRSRRGATRRVVNVAALSRPLDVRR